MNEFLCASDSHTLAHSTGIIGWIAFMVLLLFFIVALLFVKSILKVTILRKTQQQRHQPKKASTVAVAVVVAFHIVLAILAKWNGINCVHFSNNTKPEKERESEKNDKKKKKEKNNSGPYYIMCVVCTAAFFMRYSVASYLCVHKFNHWKYTDTAIHFTDTNIRTQHKITLFSIDWATKIKSALFFVVRRLLFLQKLCVGVILWPKMLHSRICIFVYSLLNGLSLLSCILFSEKKSTALSPFSGHQVGGDRETVALTLTILLTNCPFCCCTHHLKHSNALGIDTHTCITFNQFKWEI